MTVSESGGRSVPESEWYVVWSGPLSESVISESDGLSVYYARLITSTSYLRLTTFLVEALLNRTAQMLRRRRAGIDVSFFGFSRGRRTLQAHA